MTVWRWSLAGLLFALFAVPLLLPFVEAFFQSPGLSFDVPRLLSLAGNTLWLVSGTLVLALPLGIVLAVLLFRTNLPGRHVLLVATLFTLFIPLPLVVSAWQSLIGTDGLFPVWFWGANADRPWSAGIVPAIWVSALAGWPWVTLIVGIGLESVESELEEEALLAASPWRVLWEVTLPRCRAFIVAAAVWVAIQTAADVTVTDVLLVPTFAEEIHTEFTMGGQDSLARTLQIALPGLATIWIALLLIVPRLERSLLPRQLGYVRRPCFFLRGRRWPLLVVCLSGGVVLTVIPCWGLIWKLGLAGNPRGWSALHAVRQFFSEYRLNGLQVAGTLAVAILTGALAAALALVVCWAALASRCLQFFLLSLITLAWALPAPVAGIGLKGLIQYIVRYFPLGPMPFLLYDGPSPVPILWAHLLRFFPFAVAIMWPAVRLVPVELREAARLDGAGPWRELGHVYWPMTRRACVLALMTVTALSLSEVGAGARVETPGWETFAKLLFDRMHYGVDSTVAALALVLLVAILSAFAILLLARKVIRFARAGE